MFEATPPSAPFPSSLVAYPTKEALEEWSIEVVVVLDRVLVDKATVASHKARR